EQARIGIAGDRVDQVRAVAGGAALLIGRLAGRDLLGGHVPASGGRVLFGDSGRCLFFSLGFGSGGTVLGNRLVLDGGLFLGSRRSGLFGRSGFGGLFLCRSGVLIDRGSLLS